ncbi:FtsX-like permease family protein [Nocardia sp. CDC159]|uniref:FtsX-like permease family protein n=1 Tax=Nocardia pulmonis TaxID=2951408 RepID=A0A9X2E2M8_9NOCA|nr:MULTISPECIES: FtsX-like permease family protein [Nocardia]MCM6773129.1 FtsX-like permease family protein [Nocardia pulmonis]MCM6785568.1 FtsX-like permease family protein [Nocardia sp. CDC159]
MSSSGSTTLVARALARGWWRRPIRLIAAIVAGIGGIMLTTAVLLLAATVMGAIRNAPVQGVADGTIAVEAQAQAGMSEDMVAKIAAASGGAATSRMVVANTELNIDGRFRPVVVLGVDPMLPGMLDPSAVALADGRMSLTPGAVYLAERWAGEHGIGTGDDIAVATTTGVARWKVAGLLRQDFANRGAVAIAPIADVAKAYERGTNTDVLLLKPGRFDESETRSAVSAVLDGAAQVKDPADLFSGFNRTFKTPLSILAMFAAISILTASVVLFLTWRLVLTDAGPILSRLRLLGARPRDLMFGSGAVMIPILLVTYVIGAAAGLLLGRRLSAFTTQITNLTQQALNPGFPWLPAVLGALGGAVVMFGFAWLSGLLRLRRVAAIDAVNNRNTAAVTPSKITTPMLTAVAALVLAIVILLWAPTLLKAAALVPLLYAVAVLCTVVPVLAGTVLRRSAQGPTGLFVGRHLEVGWRRNAALSITFAVAMVTAIAMSGVSTSIKNEVGNSVDRWSRVNLFVQAAPTGELLTGEAMPTALAAELERVPGVRTAYGFSYASVGIDGARYPLWSWSGSRLGELTRLRVTEGPVDVLESSTDDTVAVTSNFARIQRKDVGSTLDLPLPDGHRTVRIAAIVDDSVSDGGTVIASEGLFRLLVGASGVNTFCLDLVPGADRVAVERQVRSLLADRYPRARTIDDAGLRASFVSLTGRLVSAFEAFAWVMFVVATAVGAATLASSLAERQRAIALTRLTGGRRRSVRRQLLIESTIIVAVAWVVAVPGGLLAMPAMMSALSVQSGLLPPITIPVPLLVLSLPLTLAALLIALFVARRSSQEIPLAELVAQE